MNLIGEQFVPNKPEKSNKARKIVLALIILVIIAIIAVVICMSLIKVEKLSVVLNGKESAELKSIIKFREDNTIIVPIRDIAGLLGYQSYNGNYINRSEDTSECYIETNEEVAMFTVGSNKIEKINTSNQEVTYYYIDEPIQMIDGKLYTTREGIDVAYNVSFAYDDKHNKVELYSMQYLMDYYEDSIIEAGFKGISKKFNDEKAILYNLVIVKDSKSQYGIYDLSTKSTILETKYSNIKYIPITGDFLVETNGKIGIKTSEGKDKIKIQYDSIELINQDLKLYVVKKDNKYGVINQTESVIIPINCDRIGIDSKTFAKNNIKNKYVILNRMIPVMRNNLWGLYDIEGNGLAAYKYSSFGCTSSSTRNTENVLVIPDYNVIVGCRDKKYYLINQYGEEILDGRINFDEVYMTIDLDEIKYYVVKNGKRYNAIEWLESLKDQISTKQNENENKQEEKERQEDEQNQNEQEQEEQNQDDNNQDIQETEQDEQEQGRQEDEQNQNEQRQEEQNKDEQEQGRQEDEQNQNEQRQEEQNQDEQEQEENSGENDDE